MVVGKGQDEVTVHVQLTVRDNVAKCGDPGGMTGVVSKGWEIDASHDEIEDRFSSVFHSRCVE